MRAGIRRNYELSIFTPRRERARGQQRCRRAGRVSDLQVCVDHDDRKNAECRQLLAVRELRRCLEWRACAARARWTFRQMKERPIELARELYELIAALDRRVARVERAGESAIARDGAALRAKAVARLAELAKQSSVRGASAAAPPVATSAPVGKHQG